MNKDMDAINSFEAFLKDHPDSEFARDALYQRADILLSAAQNFEKAASLEPSVKYYLALGSAWQKIGEALKAKEAFEHGQKLDPHNEHVKNKLSKLMAPKINNDING
jgi:tetratricopeptide (TPR) repeat protein